jgi:RNA polymerase sigma-70 factor (ECF subfamily)
MRPHPNETTLIQKARQGDEGALGELYRHYVDAIYRYMFYRSGDKMVAEDLTAEVFTNMISSMPNYQDWGLPFGAWLFRIARARLADYWRGIERREKYQAALTEDIARTLAQPLTRDPFRYEVLETAFTYLTDAEREALLLRFVEDLSNREIALVIHSNENAVKVKIFRALKKLRRILSERAQADTSRP